MSRLSSRGAAATILLLAACGGQPAPAAAPAPAATQAAARPLAALAAQPILVLPLQAVHPADSTGWHARLVDEDAFRRRVDEEIAFALRSRGATPQWILAEAIARSVRRNAGFAADPYALSAAPLAPGVTLKDGAVPDPLASQLRSLVALGDARYTLVPVDVRFEAAPDGAGAIATMRVALVDARASTVRGAFDVRTGAIASFSEPAIATSLAEHFADLIAAP